MNEFDTHTDTARLGVRAIASRKPVSETSSSAMSLTSASAALGVALAAVIGGGNFVSYSGASGAGRSVTIEQHRVVFKPAQRATADDRDEFLIKPAWLARAMAKLDSLSAEQVLEEESLEAARGLLNALAEWSMKPSRIVDTAEQTISIWLVTDATKVRIECCDDGQYLVSRLHEVPPTHDECQSLASVLDCLIALEA